MRLILFRHGECEGDCLTRAGKKSVKIMGPQLGQFNIKKVYSSPQKRCTQTADILSKILKIDYEVKEGLAERVSMHRSPRNESEQVWWDNYMNPNYDNNEHGESCKHFLERNCKVFEEVVANCDGGDVLLVAHSATSYALTSFIYKANGVNWMKIGNANYIVFELN